MNNFYLKYLDRDKIRHSGNLYWSHQKRQNTFALYTFEFFFPSAAWWTSIQRIHFCKFTSQPCGHSSDKASFGCFCLSSIWIKWRIFTLRFCMWNDLGLLHCTISGVLQNIHPCCIGLTAHANFAKENVAEPQPEESRPLVHWSALIAAGNCTNVPPFVQWW